MYESFEAAKRAVCAREPVFAHPQPPTRLDREREREGGKKTHDSLHSLRLHRRRFH